MLRASLRYYAATNALVVLGVAVAVAVLAGALLVGASVRESLRQLALGRLGRTDAVVTAPTFFRTALAYEVAARSSIRVAPLIVAGGAVAHDESKRSAGRVAVYGVNNLFGQFHDRPAQGVAGSAVFPAISGRDALISEALATELGAKLGDSITLRVAKPTDIPLASLQGRREVTGQRIRLTVVRILDRASLGEFSLAPSQGPVLAIYVPLERLQRDLDLGDRVNTLLLSLTGEVDDLVSQIVAPAADLDDFGLRLREGRDGNTIVETRAGLLTDPLVDGIRAIAGDNGLRSESVLAYVANTIRVGNREIPYSVVAAKGAGRGGEIRLSQWAADDLKAKVGDRVSLDYFLWSDEDGLATSSAEFTLAGILPMTGDGADPTLTPDYPGISDAPDMTSWDPPFPVDLKRVRQADEDYWDKYRAAPKAIISLEDGQRLWGSRYGKVSSVRLSGKAAINTQAFDPAAAGFTARMVRADALAAAQGTTDFGEYFLYFSFFLVVSALLLAYLFFAVGLEQRTTEVGILASMGFSSARIRGLFVREGAILAGLGAVIGAAAAIGWSALILYGLRTWWVGAVGTTELAPARRAAVARDWRDRRLGRGTGSALAGRSRHEPPIGARSLEGRHHRAFSAIRDGDEGRRGPAVDHGGGAHRRSDRRCDRSNRGILRRRRRVARRRTVRGVDLSPSAPFVEHAGPRIRGHVRPWHSPHIGAAGAVRAEPRPDRLCELRARQRRRVQEGCLGRRRRSALGHRRLHVDGRIGRAADARSQYSRRTRRTRPRGGRSDRVEDDDHAIPPAAG